MNHSEFWAQLLQDAASRPPAAEVDPLPMRSTEFSDGFGVKMTSGAGDYRLFAYYSTPKGNGPFPAIYHAPGYASVVQVPPYAERRAHAVLSLCARGQRLSDKPYAAAFPGLLTDEIDNPMKWSFRGIVADALRGIDFLLTRPEVDRERIVVVGGDIPLFVAALRPQIKGAVVADPLFPGLWDRLARTDAYPAEEINDYLRTNPGKRDAVKSTLALFDQTALLDRVRCAVLLSAAGETDAGPLAAALGQNATTYVRTGKGAVDRDHVESWISERTGQPIARPRELPPPTVPRSLLS